MTTNIVTVAYHIEDGDYLVLVNNEVDRVFQYDSEAYWWADILRKQYAESEDAAVNTETLTQAIIMAQSAAPDMAAKIAQAAAKLQVVGFEIDVDAVVIGSATHASHVYRVRAGRCQCQAWQAGRMCWHRIARRIVLIAYSLGQPGASMPRLTTIKQEV